MRQPTRTVRIEHNGTLSNLDYEVAKRLPNGEWVVHTPVGLVAFVRYIPASGAKHATWIPFGPSGEISGMGASQLNTAILRVFRRARAAVAVAKFIRTFGGNS